MIKIDLTNIHLGAIDIRSDSVDLDARKAELRAFFNARIATNTRLMNEGVIDLTTGTEINRRHMQSLRQLDAID